MDSSVPASSQTAPTPVSDQQVEVQHRSPVSLQSMLLLALLVAGFGGLLAARLDHWLGSRVWPGAVLMGIVILLLGKWLHRRIVQPLAQVRDDLDISLARRRPAIGCKAIAEQGGEIGQLAYLVHELSADVFRNNVQVNQLRRTMDHRVAESTRRATIELQHKALRDPLTNLANRRFVEEHLEDVVLSCRASSSDLICLAMDLDNFKGVNDTFGHATGDRLLICIAQIIRATIRADDIAVRTGGDEFLVFLPGCSIDQAKKIAARIMELFRQQVHVQLPPTLKTDVSIGGASLARDRCANGKELIHSADQYLYNGKQNGKGRIVGLDI